MEKLSSKDRFANYYGVSNTLIYLNKKAENYDRFNNLYRKVLNDNNIRYAIKRISTNPGRNTPGPDGETFKSFTKQTDVECINQIRNILINSYDINSITKQIPKSDGINYRIIGITNISVRIAQQAILNILEPILEAQFSNNSFGFRRNKTTKHCVAKIAKSLQQTKEAFIYDCDLKSYFDCVNLDIVLDKLYHNHNIKDKKLLKMIKKVMWINSNNNSYNGIGLSQGSILGPILANVMLHDWEIKLAKLNGIKSKNINEFSSFRNCNKSRVNKGEEYYKKYRKDRRYGVMYRYADDFIIVSNNIWDLEDIIDEFKNWCETNGLIINDNKTKILTKSLNKTFSLDFLGYQIKINSRNRLIISIKNQKVKIREIKKHVRREFLTGNTSKAISIIFNYFNYYDINTNLNHLVKVIENILYKLSQRSYLTKCIKKDTGTYEVWSTRDNQKSVTTLNLWNIRSLTTSSIKEYLIEDTTWKCTLDTKNDSLLKWGRDLIEYRSIHNTSNRINGFIPGLIKMQRKEPLMNIPLNEIDIKDIEIHHKIPKHLGGTDDFKNLIILHKDSHNAIHYPQSYPGLHLKQTKLQYYRNMAIR